MISLLFQKLIHKKWMVICLLVGNILLIAVSVSHPLYRSSSFQRMLTDEFKEFEETNQTNPAVFKVMIKKAANTSGANLSAVDNFVKQSVETFDLPVKRQTNFFSTMSQLSTPVIERDDQDVFSFIIAAMTDINDHIELVYGRFPNEGLTEDGYIEVMAPEICVSAQNVLLDEEFSLNRLYDYSGNENIKIRVVGIFKPLNSSDSYWVEKPSGFAGTVFVSMDTFKELFMKDESYEDIYSLSLSYYTIWDYEEIRPQDVKRMRNVTEELENTKTFGKFVQRNQYIKILESYSAKAKKVEASLIILEVPALLLLCAFLYMISGQMVEMEQTEITLLKSRGAKRSQIIFLYFGQSLVLGLISLGLGLPLGTLMCKVLGSASDFLEFSSKRELKVVYTSDVALYAGGALLLGIIMTLIPVIKYSKLTIVTAKQMLRRKKKTFWKSAFLDVIFLLISLYGFYSFNKTQGNVIEAVLSGESLDPLLYFSSSLFILGASLLFLRLQPILVTFIYKLRKNKMSPAVFVSFMDAKSAGKKQEFIMIFLMLTVALGIYNAYVARTIVSNAEKNASYVNGCELAIKEVWSDNSKTVEMDPSVEFKYYEPDFSKYEVIEGVEATAKVLNKSMSVSTGGKNFTSRLMGIYPSDFSKISSMDDGLLYYDYYDYLNVLASVDNACLVSENFMIEKGLKIGDVITFHDSKSDSVTTKIYGFFNYWPSYSPNTYSLNSDGSIQVESNYLIVANLSYLESNWSVTPYEVWLKTSDLAEGFYKYLEDTPTLRLTKLEDLSEIKEEIRTDTLFQGTNGILTMTFIIVLILCAVGYMIYWIMSIRSRELLFGVLRATGMRKKEIMSMLITEQLLCGLYSILAGSLIGFLTSYLYVPLVESAYAASNQVLPLELVFSGQDMLKLFASIGVVILICVVVIVRIVSKMDISKALKLGEE